MSQDFSCSDKETLIAYIYGECAEEDRRRVEAHAASCRACADEIAGIGSVREALVAWTPAPAAGSFRIVRDAEEGTPAKVLRPARWWRRPVPAWARAAAAVLLVAGGAGLANLDVHYGADGLTVRTGWRHPADTAASASARVQAPAATIPASATATPWRADLAALERQLRGDFGGEVQALRASMRQPSPASTQAADDRVMARVRQLIDESEQRQQREMAYRVSQVQGELSAQRRADLYRVQAGLGQLQGQTGEEVMKQRQLINYLLTVSQKK